MEKKPQISVIMATQSNNMNYLVESISSIINQTLKNIEVIIIFDGCDIDENIDFIQSKFSDPRIRFIFSKKWRGLARCLNICARLARADLLARMDDDDRCLPNRLERQIEVMKNRDIDVLGTYAWIIDKDGSRIPNIVLKSNPITPLSPIRSVFGQIFLHPSVVMKRNWLLKYRYNRRWQRGQDRELWVRASNSSKYHIINEPLLEYRRVNSIKKVQMNNIMNAYRLIWSNRSHFGFYVPILILINLSRQIYYYIRISMK